MRSILWSMLLTLSALLGLGGMVYFIMHFVTGQQVGLPMAYWFVPLFGAGGGAVGGVLRNDNKLALCAVEFPDKIRLGVMGDICIGVGGACAVVFLFGNTLRIDLKDAVASVLLISVSFLAGVFGKNIVEMAGQRLLRLAEEKAKATAKEEVAPSAAIAYAYAATQMNNGGQEIAKALEMAEMALKYDPKSLHAYVEKARALKRMGKIKEALATVEEAVRIKPEEPRLLYNRACYKSLLNMNSEEILKDLRTAFEALPELRDHARKDPDLESVRNLPEFNQLIGVGDQTLDNGHLRA